MIFLADGPSIFDTIANLLGISSGATEASIATLLTLALLYALRILFTKEKTEADQTGLSRELVGIASRTIDSYEKNNVVLASLQTTLEDLRRSFLAEMQGFSKSLHKHETEVNNNLLPLSEAIRDVKANLIVNNHTRVVVKDKTTGAIFAEFSAEPAIDDAGKPYLVVEYDLKSSI